MVFMGFVFIGIGVVIYILPAILAHKMKHPNAISITILNIALGWTLLGWVGSLVWAYTKKQPEDLDEPKTIEPPAPLHEDIDTGTKQCPFCAEDIKAAAIKCKHCGSDLLQTP